jgi:UDP-N-acetylmuramoylalanine--D-glutamate ligase
VELAGKKVVVMGLARTGEAVARFCLERQASVTVTDSKPESALGRLPGILKALGARMVLGGHDEQALLGADLVVLSPGVPHTLPVLEKARANGVPVLGEVELAGRFIREPLCCITGTNGKSTVTTLVGEMLAQAGKKVFVGGNLGNPLINYVNDAQKAAVVVVEISSFQADTLELFAPSVAVLLNITPDHLDRYPDMEAYAQSKARLFANQSVKEWAVLNGADKWVRRLAGAMPAKKLFFTGAREDEPGARFADRAILCRLPGGETFAVSLERTSLVGAHNFENIAASALAAYCCGASPEAIQRAVDSFTGLAHRLETVDEINSVRFVNDSKATNVDAALRALESFSSPVIIIMGGRDKKGDFGALADTLARRAKLLITTGEAAPIIRKALSNVVETLDAADMAQALKLAALRARPGDVVLLAPGCASFDAYSSYKERGNDFIKLVKGLK